MTYSEAFLFDIQIKGYYVFYANSMGSDDRGDAYADRLGVTGDFYGGDMTN